MSNKKKIQPWCQWKKIMLSIVFYDQINFKNSLDPLSPHKLINASSIKRGEKIETRLARIHLTSIKVSALGRHYVSARPRETTEMGKLKTGDRFPPGNGGRRGVCNLEKIFVSEGHRRPNEWPCPSDVDICGEIQPTDNYDRKKIN